MSRSAGEGGKPGLSVKYPYAPEEELQSSAVSVSFSRPVEIVPIEVSGVAGRGTREETIVEDIPVTVEREVTTNQHFVYKYRDPGVPGGAGIKFGYGLGDSTIGTVVWDTVADTYALCVSGHAANNYGYEMYQPKAEGNYTPDDPNYIGEVDANRVREDSNFDAAITNGLVDGISTYGYHARNRDNNYSSDPIDGALSKDRLNDLCYTGGELGKQGISTGIEYGTVEDVGDTYFTTTADNADGNSGGPHYEEQDGTFVIAGIHKGAANGGKSKATIMKEIEDLWKVRVVSSGGSCSTSSVRKQDNTC